jgi:hypothetical protein
MRLGLERLAAQRLAEFTPAGIPIPIEEAGEETGENIA